MILILLISSMIEFKKLTLFKLTWNLRKTTVSLFPLKTLIKKKIFLNQISVSHKSVDLKIDKIKGILFAKFKANKLIHYQKKQIWRQIR